SQVRLQSIVLILALWLALGILTMWDENAEMRNARASASALADTLTANAMRVMREAEQVAALVAWQVQKDGVSVPLGSYVTAGLLKLDVFVQVAVIDPHGYLRASTVSGFIPIDLSDREHFKVHLHDPSTALMIGKPLVGRVSGKPSLQLSRRINSADGRFLGVVVVSVDPSYFTDLYNGLRLRRHAVLSVIGSRDFVIRALRSGSDDSIGAALPPRDPLRLALSRAPTGNLRVPWFADGRDTIVSYRSLTDYPLTVSVGYSTDEYLSAWRTRSLLLLAAAALLTMLIIMTERRTKVLLENLAASNRREMAKAEQLEHARLDAEAASRAKSAFLATMSHEIRTPMNGVMGMTEVLTRSTLSADQKDMVRTIRDCASALLKIIDDVLDFSKIEAGKLQVESVPVSIEDIVDGLASSLATVADARGVALRTYVSPELPGLVMSDDTRVREILYNLVGNAIKFSSGRDGVEGRVSLRATLGESATPEVRFEIADNGIGMTSDTIAKLFLPFSQAEASTRRRFGGTGLGLAICRRLVALLGGDMSVVSEPGRGSTFVVRLPLTPAPGAPERRMAALGGLACVVVASPDWRCDDIAHYLRCAGADVSIARDADEAHARLASAGAHVVLVHGELSGVAVPRLAGEVRITAARELALTAHTGNAVSIGAQALRRRALLDAVALAAGRVLPDADDVGRGASQDEAHRARARAASETRDTDGATRARGALILVAEDDAINRKVISRQLGLLGYAADMATDGDEALHMWRATPYTLVLTDLHMPNRDGYELAQAIRDEEAQALRPRVPIVALTANAIHGEASRAKALGIDDYLTKPLKLDLLREALEKWTVGANARPAPIACPTKSAIAVTSSTCCASIAPAAPRADAPAQASGIRVDIDIDIEIVRGIVGDDDEMIHAVLAEYIDCTAQLAHALRRHLSEGHAREAGALAHRLKSSSRSIGALPLGELCARIESLATQPAAAGIAELVALAMQFDTAYGRAIGAARRLVQSTQADRSGES
ncbi:MAG TPA: ATP-binding protein, partial [Trinickia sp.]|nr:ATP-binding protein [Trinickia sp.]